MRRLIVLTTKSKMFLPIAVFSAVLLNSGPARIPILDQVPILRSKENGYVVDAGYDLLPVATYGDAGPA